MSSGESHTVYVFLISVQVKYMVKEIVTKQNKKQNQNKNPENKQQKAKPLFMLALK